MQWDWNWLSWILLTFHNSGPHYNTGWTHAIHVSKEKGKILGKLLTSLYQAEHVTIQVEIDVWEPNDKKVMISYYQGNKLALTVSPFVCMCLEFFKFVPLSLSVFSHFSHVYSILLVRWLSSLVAYFLITFLLVSRYLMNSIVSHMTLENLFGFSVSPFPRTKGPSFSF